MSTIVVGYDASGNQNAWTANNIDNDTTSTTTDIFVDVPTPWGTDTGAGGEVRGNYATWNPLDRTAATYTNGNLEVSSTSSAAPYNMTTTIQLPTSGKWYCEVTALKGASNPGIGIGNNRPLDQFAVYRNTGAYITANISGIASSGTPATWTTGDVIGIAYDADAGTLSFYKNGSAQSGGFTSVPATGYCVAVRADSASGDGGTLNAGQRPFAYTAPSGFKALCTQNLPEPTVKDGSQYMDALLYTGNGSASQRTDISWTNMQPDMVWVKSRSNAYNNDINDDVRGVTQALCTNSTAVEDGPVAFGSDGFGYNGVSNQLRIFTSDQRWNANAATYVAWGWKGSGAAGVSNTQGTITSTVSANATAGFSIITYTGNGTSGATIGHGLSSAPAFFVVKGRSFASNWLAQHVSVGNGSAMTLNSTAAASASSTYWNNTSPSSTVITLGNGSETNPSGSTMVCYAFAPVAGYSAFGSYTGNGSTDGPFVYTGFRPRFVLIKRTDSAASWAIMDSARSPYNAVAAMLYPNSASAEGGSTDYWDFTSNGMKIRNSFADPSNASGGTYIYAAFAENPFKYALAR